MLATIRTQIEGIVGIRDREQPAPEELPSDAVENEQEEE